MVLGIIGFGVIAGILYLIMSKKTAPVVAFIVVPIIGALIAGQASEIGSHISAGIQSMAPTGVMFIFSVLFFGIMRDSGAFDPIVNGIIKLAKGNTLLIVIGTYIISIIGHLDGSGATTFLLVVPAMLPIYEKLGMSRLVLTCVTAMGAGTMNITPWGGPTLRAATVLEMNAMELYRPVIIPQLIGLALGLVFSYFLGKKEQERLGHLEESATIEDEYSLNITDEEKALRRPRLVIPNIILIIIVIAIMISGLISPAASFMIGTAIALILNYPNSEDQKIRIDSHAEAAMMMASVLFSAGVLLGIFKESGMASSMANIMVSILPNALGRFMAVILGFISMPLSLVFDPDSYYFGVMPVLAETAKAFGVPAVDIARVSIIGQITVGFPISPLTPATFLLVGLAGVELGEHQKFSFKYLYAISAVIMISMLLMGVLSL